MIWDILQCRQLNDIKDLCHIVTDFFYQIFLEVPFWSVQIAIDSKGLRETDVILRFE